MGKTSHQDVVADLRQRSWSWLLRNVVIPLGDLVYGQRVIERLRFLEAAQWWDTERLHAHRDRLLASLMQTAYQEVPFYRNLMERAGITEHDIRSPEDLFKLPVVTKDMLRSGYPQLTTRNTKLKTYEVCSSGSTGTNFHVRCDSETAGWYQASKLLAYTWAGWRMGEPHLQTGISPNRNRGRWLKDLFLRCHYVSAFDLSNDQLDLSLDVLERYSVQHLWGYPGSLYFLARRALEKGWNLQLKTIVTWGDNLYPHYRTAIESVFKARIFDTYGCSEGMQIAAQCGKESSYHVHTLDVIVQCLDDNGSPVSAGQPGNVILTRLHPGPMPLIRYQVGDIAVMGSSRLCECGRGYDIMESIQGRDTDVVVTPSGNRLIVHFFTGILEYFSEIHSFQVVQEELGSMLLRIVPTSEFTRSTPGKIIAKLQEKGAADIRIDIELVDNLPATLSGKRRFVVSNISKVVVGSNTN